MKLIADTDSRLGMEFNHNFPYYSKSISPFRNYGGLTKEQSENILTDGSWSCLYFYKYG